MTPQTEQSEITRVTPIKAGLAAMSGLLMTAAFPKAGQAYLAWVAWVPLLLSLRDTSPKTGFMVGLVGGVVHYLSLLYWLVYTMGVYGHLPVYQSVPVLFLMSAYLSLYMAFFAWLSNRFCSRPILLFTLPIFWVALEYLRGFFLTGFPWGLFGYSQYSFLHLIQIADIVGVYGVSFLLMLSNVAILIFVLQRLDKTWQGASIPKRLPGLGLGVVLILILIVLVYGRWQIKTFDAEMARWESPAVTVVQGNIDQDKKWDPAFQLLTTTKYRDLSLSAASMQPELIVWPETATPFYLFHHSKLTKIVLEGVKASKTSHIIGSPSAQRRGKEQWYYNSAYIIDPQGKTIGKYDKVHLVPFGEYVPMQRWLPFLGKMVAQVGDMHPGEKGNTLAWNGHRLGIQICYEIIFPELSAAMTRKGADLLINITNDAWFDRTSAAYQHFSMAVFRAVENRRSLVRSANTGISGFVDPVGRILAATPLFEEKVVTEHVPLSKANSFYSRHGDLFAKLCFGLLISYILLGLVSKYRMKKN
jgi:apolipoprotein N-acyltransferase